MGNGDVGCSECWRHNQPGVCQGLWTRPRIVDHAAVAASWWSVRTSAGCGSPVLNAIVGDRVDLPSAVLVAPPVIRLLRNTQLPGNLRNRLSLGQQPIGLPQLQDDLFRRITTTLHHEFQSAAPAATGLSQHPYQSTRLRSVAHHQPFERVLGDPGNAGPRRRQVVDINATSLPPVRRQQRDHRRRYHGFSSPKRSALHGRC